MDQLADAKRDPTGDADAARATASLDAAAASSSVANIRFAYASGSKPLSGYTIKRGIGRGGFGEVYYAISDGGKEVALKLIRRNFDVELRGVAHCLNLKHPNLIALYDIRSDDQDDSWVVMEFVSGGSLEQIIADHPNGAPHDQVNAWFRGVVAGVAYLHDRGIVHRDLKPGNIFSDEGMVKIGDYGLAKFISCSRRSGQTESVGTVHYMAPEIAKGRYGKEIDIYALGVMLFEMLTGQVPFAGESVGEVLMKHLTAEPDLSDIQEPYRAIVARCLDKDPDVRYGSAAELMADLPAVAAGVSIASVAPSFAQIPEVGQAPAARPAANASDGSSPEQHDPRQKVLSDVVLKNYTESDESLSKYDPIERAARRAAKSLRAWYGTLTPVQQTIVIAAVAIVGVSNLPWVVIILVVGGVSYGIYRMIWHALYGGTQQNEAPDDANLKSYLQEEAGRAAEATVEAEVVEPSPTAGVYTRQNHPGWQRPKPGIILPEKSRHTWLAELTGSMLLSAIACLVLSVVMVIFQGGSMQPAQLAWLALTTIGGSWAVLVPGKVWERTYGEPALRRFVLLIFGLGLGLASFGLHQFLFVSLTDEMQMMGHAVSLIGLTDFLAFFGFLFLVLRWWKSCDPLRHHRVNLWTTAGAVFWALMLSLWFPQPWGMMVAGTISVAVQLGSPWLNAAARAEFARPPWQRQSTG